MTAAAINADTGTVVSPTAPLRAGVDVVALFLTGLGATTRIDNLDYARDSTGRHHRRTSLRRSAMQGEFQDILRWIKSTVPFPPDFLAQQFR